MMTAAPFGRLMMGVTSAPVTSFRKRGDEMSSGGAPTKEKVMADEVSKSFSHLMRALSGATRSLYRLAPAAVVVLMVLVTTLVLVVILLLPQLMMSFVVLLVVFTSVLIYGTTNRVGEAAIALVAGLLAAFTVQWTAGKFASIVGAWTAFFLMVLIISSIKVSARTELLYLRAALAVSPDDLSRVEKELRVAGGPTPLKMLGPVERAECVLLLAFRKTPVWMMKGSLTGIEQVAVATQTDYKVVASWVADLYRIVGIVGEKRRESVPSAAVGDLVSLMIDSPASPEEFFAAFRSTRRLVLSGKMDIDTYIDRLRTGFEKGLLPDEMYQYMTEQL